MTYASPQCQRNALRARTSRRSLYGLPVRPDLLVQLAGHACGQHLARAADRAPGAAIGAEGVIAAIGPRLLRPGQRGQRYHPGIEDQLGGLGLVLNCVVLGNTTYLNAALDQLRAQGYPVRGEDAARLSPFVTRHLNVLGHYSFRPPDLGGRHRPLRDAGAEDDEE